MTTSSGLKIRFLANTWNGKGKLYCLFEQEAPLIITDLYRIRKADLAKCAEVSTRAFLDDPALKYQMGGKKPSFRQLKNYFDIIFQTGFPYYDFFAPSEKIEGVIGLLPPNAGSVPPLEFLFRGGWKMPFTVYRDVLGRLEKYETHSLEIRRNVGAMSAWYVMMLAVDPEEQGKGFGAKMLRAFLSEMDAEGSSCYLETHKLVNTEIYRHFGFEIVSIDTVPDGTDTQYAMLRKPAVKL